MTDQDHAKAIREALDALERACVAATAAGLEVHFDNRSYRGVSVYMDIRAAAGGGISHYLPLVAIVTRRFT